MADKKRISFQINDGRTFFADEVSITNNPTKIILDFKKSTPRVDVRAERQGVPIVLEHNSVMMDTYLAKRFYELLGNHLEKYEDQYGEIEEPEQLAQAKAEHDVTSTDEDKPPGYFG